ncbi:MAG: hypothetical protein LUG18_11570 [Candidatus Azobacteroides sp.]|nr:hypothetical protein [Candidatus Azobacteroides sp.]
MFDKQKITTFTENLRKEVKRIFHSDEFRKLSIFLFFLLLAFFFWLLNSFREDYTSTYRVPVTFVNLPPEAIVTTDLPEKLQVTVVAKGVDIIRYNYRHGFSPVEIDISQLNKTRDSYTITSEQLREEISKQLYKETQVLSIYPSYIEVAYDKKESKRVPVVMNGKVLPASQWTRSGDIILSPRTVTLYGTKEGLDTIKSISTEYFEVRDLRDTLIKKVDIQKITGIKAVPAQVTVTVPIEEFTEKTIEVPVHALNVPENLSVRTFPSKVHVSFFVVLSRFNDVKPEDFEVSVDYVTFEQNNGNGKHAIYLSKFPDFVQNVRINPAEADILVEEKIEDTE